MKNKEVLFYLILQSAEGIGDINAKKLISHCGSAQAVIEEKSFNLEKIPGIGSYTINGLNNTSLYHNAEKELEFINNNNIEALTFVNEKYPKNRTQCVDGPIVLFQTGNIN